MKEKTMQVTQEDVLRNALMQAQSSHSYMRIKVRDALKIARIGQSQYRARGGDPDTDPFNAVAAALEAALGLSSTRSGQEDPR